MSLSSSQKSDGGIPNCEPRVSRGVSPADRRGTYLDALNVQTLLHGIGDTTQRRRLIASDQQTRLWAQGTTSSLGLPEVASQATSKLLLQSLKNCRQLATATRRRIDSDSKRETTYDLSAPHTYHHSHPEPEPHHTAYPGGSAGNSGELGAGKTLALHGESTAIAGGTKGTHLVQTLLLGVFTVLTLGRLPRSANCAILKLGFADKANHLRAPVAYTAFRLDFRLRKMCLQLVDNWTRNDLKIDIARWWARVVLLRAGLGG